MAPEVLSRKPANSKVDTWGLGVILYLFMTGYLPFQGKNRETLFKKINSGSCTYELKEFEECSKEVIDLIKNLLIVDQTKRFSASQALEHDWFKVKEHHHC